MGLVFNELVRSGRVKAPIVIGRDHLDAGSVASPNRETEGMRDGSDAVADWPILNALLNAVSGATGSPSTTAAASAWATRSTPAWSWWRTGRPRRRPASSACSPPTPARASCATWTPATSARIDVARERGVKIPML